MEQTTKYLMTKFNNSITLTPTWDTAGSCTLVSVIYLDVVYLELMSTLRWKWSSEQLLTIHTTVTIFQLTGSGERIKTYRSYCYNGSSEIQQFGSLRAPSWWFKRDYYKVHHFGEESSCYSLRVNTLSTLLKLLSNVKCSIAVALPNQPMALLKLISCFSYRNMNITKIDTRPASTVFKLFGHQVDTGFTIYSLLKEWTGQPWGIFVLYWFHYWWRSTSG